MKTNKLPALIAFSAFAIMSFSSCEKSDVKPQDTPAVNTQATIHTTKDPVYDAGIRSNQGYPSTGTTDRAYYRLYYNTALGQQAIVNYAFGGDAASTIRGYGAMAGTEVFVYQQSGINLINYNGSENLIMLGVNYFTLPIEEIEIDPSSGDVYAICKNGNSIQIYRIDQYGAATQMTYNGSGTVFYNPNGNGYKSGSIAFVPDGSGGYYLVFSSESTVYASLGVVCWYFTISGTTLSIQSSQNKTYTGLPTSSTTKINTCYGDGKFYFARDGGAVYSLGSTNNSITNEGFSVTNANDFGYWKNF